MKIAIIGAGFTSLSAAWYLSQFPDIEITIFEKEMLPGGLASGFKKNNWQYYLDKHYHHVFANDSDISQLLTAMDLRHLFYFQHTQTFTLYQNNLAQLDSALSLLQFPFISLPSRIRTGLGIALLKLIINGRFLERYSAQDFIKKLMGEESWRVIWQPLFHGKFAWQQNQINAAWFWARIYARSKKLAYFQGGFTNLALQMIKKLEKRKVKILLKTKINEIKKSQNGFQLLFHDLEKKINKVDFDQILITTPSIYLNKLIPQYIKQFPQLNQYQSLAAQTIILQLNKAFFKQAIYWLNINEKDWPFLALVEHTNFIDKKYYGNKHFLYVSRYLPRTSQEYQLDKNTIFKSYLPYLNEISTGFEKNLEAIYLFKEDFAQPICKLNHSRILPTITTPIKNLYWASMQHIYPFDRGVNYAVKLGKLAAQTMIEE